MSYTDFVEGKKHSSIDDGIPITDIPSCLFPFQAHIVELAARRGRFACFEDTGLGKTIQELVLAQHYAKTTGKPTLILTPLAVAYQFEREAEKFGVADCSQTKDGTFSSDVVTCNYERMHKLDPYDFGCVILDESSILKNFDGKIKNQINSFMREVKYRFLFTATPAPNDFIELGTSSEALGFLGYMDMLSMFFTNKEKTSDPTRVGSPWYLKDHAEEDFFSWVSTWSISIKRPEDLGFSDSGYDLPDLVENNSVVQFSLPEFADLKKLRMTDLRKVQKESVGLRCERAAELALANDKSVIWCHRNDEADELTRLVGCPEVSGSMNVDKKEEVLLAFATGEVDRLVTKPKITGFGLNWQHCNHTVYFPTYSFEQYYQSIRRFWRFGQKQPVTVDRVLSSSELQVLDTLESKSVKAGKLYVKLNEKLNSDFSIDMPVFDERVKSPSFLR